MLYTATTSKPNPSQVWFDDDGLLNYARSAIKFQLVNADDWYKADGVAMVNISTQAYVCAWGVDKLKLLAILNSGWMTSDSWLMATPVMNKEHLSASYGFYSNMQMVATEKPQDASAKATFRAVHDFDGTGAFGTILPGRGEIGFTLATQSVNDWLGLINQNARSFKGEKMKLKEMLEGFARYWSANGKVNYFGSLTLIGDRVVGVPDGTGYNGVETIFRLGGSSITVGVKGKYVTSPTGSDWGGTSGIIDPVTCINKVPSLPGEVVTGTNGRRWLEIRKHYPGSLGFSENFYPAASLGGRDCWATMHWYVHYANKITVLRNSGQLGAFKASMQPIRTVLPDLARYDVPASEVPFNTSGSLYEDGVPFDVVCKEFATYAKAIVSSSQQYAKSMLDPNVEDINFDLYDSEEAFRSAAGSWSAKARTDYDGNLVFIVPTLHGAFEYLYWCTGYSGANASGLCHTIGMGSYTMVRQLFGHDEGMFKAVEKVLLNDMPQHFMVPAAFRATHPDASIRSAFYKQFVFGETGNAIKPGE